MKRLDRYVILELLIPLVIGTVLIALLFVANDMIAIFKSLNVDAIPGTAILQLLLLKLPQWLSLTLPIGAALGTSLALSRLARESEVTAMRASGIRVIRVCAPGLVVGLLIGVLNFTLVEHVVPPALKEYRRLAAQIGVLGTVPQFRSNVILQIDRFTASLGTVSRGSGLTVNLTDIVLFERPRRGETVIYTSPNGEYRDGVWTIRRPTVYRLQGATLNTVVSQDSLSLNEPIRLIDLFTQPLPEEETVASLKAAVASLKNARQPTIRQEVALHQKFALPFSCFIFALNGALLSIKLSRSGPFVGVLFSLSVVWMHFNLNVISSEILGRLGWLPPALAAWTPNLLFFALAIGLLRSIE